MINTAMSTRITESCVRSVIFFDAGLIMSIVSVDDEVSTREESVDIDADRTRSMTTAMSRSGRPESMVGMMES